MAQRQDQERKTLRPGNFTLIDNGTVYSLVIKMLLVLYMMFSGRVGSLNLSKKKRESERR